MKRNGFPRLKNLVVNPNTKQYKNSLRECIVLQKFDQLDLQNNQESLDRFLSEFDRTSSTLAKQARQAFEDLLVEFPDIFGRQRIDIGINNDFDVKLTTIYISPAYSQNPPTPINLKEDITVKLAFLHEYSIISSSLFSKDATPLFALKKPNDKLVDLRKINNLISEEYSRNHHPISALLHAAKHMAGKKNIL